MSLKRVRRLYFFLGMRLHLTIALLLFIVDFAAHPCAAQSTHSQNSTGSSIRTNPAAPVQNEPVPDLSGIWERRDESGSGSFGGVAEGTEPAVLTPPAKKIVDEARARLAAGQILTHASRYCQDLGMPFIMGQSPPIDIVQSKDEILIASEQPSAARHIYTDGQGHPPLPAYEPTTNGHSIGHWEGDNLVVDTIGFSNLGIQNVPGGGLRTSTSHLVERFHLFDGGTRLSIKFTWDDPNVYLKPHTYEIKYYKDPPDAYVLENFCDAGDPAQGQSVVPPAQN